MEISTRSCADLPSEVLALIFEQVPRNTLIVCLNVCKSWHFTAKEFVYASITTGKRDLSKLVKCLDQTCAGELVKSLRIDEHLRVEQDALLHLIKACHNLQELHIINNAKLLRWIYESGELDLHDLRIITPLGRSSWRYSQQNMLLFLVAHKFRNSLETLKVPCVQSPVKGIQVKNTLEYLASFAKLRNLILIDGSMNDVVYFDELLSACRNLQTLNMQLGHPLYDEDNGGRCTTLPTTTYPTLFTLDFYLNKFSVEYIQYMINRFINLKSFTLRINESSSDWSKDKDKIEQFLIMEYIPFVRKLQYASLNIKTNGSSSIGDFFSRFTIWDKKGMVKTDAYFQIENSRSERTDIGIETKKNNQRHASLIAKYTFEKDFSHDPNAELPYTRHLFSYGSQITFLHIHLSHTVKRGVDFGFILDQCPNVEQIIIHITYAQPRQYRWFYFLDMYNSTPNIYWEDKPDHRENKALTSLEINGGMITHTLLDSISKRACNLKKLSLLNCTFPEGTTTFNMTNLNIKEFKLDTCMFYHTDRQYTHIVITSTEEKQSDYYIFDKKAFKHVSATYFSTHCATMKETYPLLLEFNFNLIESMQVFLGNYYDYREIENIFFLHPEYFSYKSPFSIKIN